MLTERSKQLVSPKISFASAMGMQSPIVLVVTNKEKRDALSRLNAKYDPRNRQDPFYGAPVILSVIVPKKIATAIYDGSLVLGNMMLAAHSLGIGSCWIHRAKEVFDDEEGKAFLRDLGLDDEYEGIGNLAIGYAKQFNSNVVPRKDNRVYHI